MNKEEILRQAEIIKESKLFDENYYYTTYPHIAQNNVDALLHYLIYGAKEGKNPNACFDSKLYLKAHFEVAEANINPFLHYVAQGRFEGRKLFFEKKEDALVYIEQAENIEEKLFRLATFFDNFPECREEYKEKFDNEMAGSINTLYAISQERKENASIIREKVKKQIFFNQLVASLPKKEQIQPKKSLCIISKTANALKYYSPFLQKIPKEELTIIIEDKDIPFEESVKIIESYGLVGYEIVNDLVGLENYSTLMCDFLRVASHNPNKKLIEHLEKYKETKLIGLIHSSDFIPTQIEQKHFTAIMHCEKNNTQISPQQADFFFDDKSFSFEMLEEIAPYAKTEYTYTGPFQMGDYLKKLHEHKENFRKELEEHLSIKFDKNKKIAFVLEDELSDFHELVEGMNALAEHMYVIFKPFAMPQTIIEKLSPKVILYQTKALAPNVVRFGADIVLAGFDSGTFFSSCMLGIPVIPFYVPWCRKKNVKQITPLHTRNILDNGFSFESFFYNVFSNKKELLEQGRTIESSFALKLHFAYHKKIYNLLDTESLIKAINENEYLDWYGKNIKNLQEKAFKDYFLENAAEKTAEYILDYAKNGTFGTNCASVYLKPEYVNF